MVPNSNFNFNIVDHDQCHYPTVFPWPQLFLLFFWKRRREKARESGGLIKREKANLFCLFNCLSVFNSRSSQPQVTTTTIPNLFSRERKKTSIFIFNNKIIILIKPAIIIRKEEEQQHHLLVDSEKSRFVFFNQSHYFDSSFLSFSIIKRRI